MAAVHMPRDAAPEPEGESAPEDPAEGTGQEAEGAAEEGGEADGASEEDADAAAEAAAGTDAEADGDGEETGTDAEEAAAAEGEETSESPPLAPRAGPPEYAGVRGRGRRREGPPIVRLNYKDVATLARFLNDQGRILPKRTTRVAARFQRELGTAVKRARFLGLLPSVRHHGS